MQVAHLVTNGVVEFHLLLRHGGQDEVLALGRQEGEHISLEAAQQKGVKNGVQFADGLVLALLLYYPLRAIFTVQLLVKVRSNSNVSGGVNSGKVRGTVITCSSKSNHV